jgi:SAM-dependent methyltransferase
MSGTPRLSRHAYVPSWVRHEHHARYVFASAYVKGRRVVDCACGEGFGTAVFARAGAASIGAFDQSAAAIAAATARYHLPAVQFGVSHANHLPVADRSVDVYIALETIEHLDDARGFLEEAGRVLIPHGLFICSTPNRDVTNPGTTTEDRPRNPFHVREYARQDLEPLLWSVFGRVAWFGQNPVPGPWRWMLEAAGRRSPRGAALLTQCGKLRWLCGDSAARHTVEPIREGRSYEYLVAVCER